MLRYKCEDAIEKNWQFAHEISTGLLKQEVTSGVERIVTILAQLKEQSLGIAFDVAKQLIEAFTVPAKEEGKKAAS